ncbi:MAG: ribonuclease D [Chromatiales bacterium]|jgi:ribonuclease D
MQELFVDTEEQLDQLCLLLKDSKWLSIDTEFIREKTYYPVFCLLQISNGEVTACVDPLALPQLDPLLEILYDESIVKVLHAAHQDLEIFYHLWQRLPTPIFDTQLVAAITGYGDQIGYARLVQQMLSVSLEKDQARTDWSKRPLDQRQLRYAMNDVIYLGEIYEKLHEKITRLGRENWLDAEYVHFADPDTFRIHPEQAWKKVKGRQHLKGVQYAVLQKLSAWREQTAIDSDRPRRWILKDEVLIDLARRAPKNAGQLERIRGLEPGQIRKSGDRILTLIAEAKQMPADSWPVENIPTRKLDRQEEAIADLLMCGLRLIADANDITASAIASRKDLEKIIAGSDDTELLRGWRKKIAGDSLLKMRHGQLMPCWEKDKLVLQSV